MEFNDDQLEEDLKKEEEEEEEKDEINSQDINPQKKRRHFKKMKTTKLSSFPDLISINENAKTQEMGEKKDLDKKLWIPDEDVQNCYNCGYKFVSLFGRKHHCRVCGNIFCKSCLETFYEITIYNEKQELKVCAYCLNNKRTLNKILKDNLVEYNDENGNKIFKTKTWDYVRNKKKNEINIDKFCGFNKTESKLLKEFHHNLDKNYEMLLKKMVNKILTEKSNKIKFPNLVEDWEIKIYNITNKVINNLSPSFTNLNDSIDINDYLKIKTIEFRNQSKCEVIDGYAMRKNVCSKNMRNNILKPKILLLEGPLEGLRSNRGKVKTNNNLIIKSSAIEAYIEIIRKKIEALSPQLILVEGNVLQKFQNFFAMDKMNISVVSKVDKKKLNLIARCVNSFVVPSPDLIGKNIILGSCAKFEVQKIKLGMSIENKNNILHMKQEDYYLMRFEGCGKYLFNTVILSGPNKEELKELKILMKIIIKTARHLYCQKFLMKYLNLYYEPSILNENEEKKEKNINNIKIKKTRRKSSIYRDDSYFLGFDVEIINEKSNYFECDYLDMQNKNKIEIPQSEQDKNNPSLKESEVLKSTPSRCSTNNYVLNAYSSAEDEEKTFGHYILSFLEEEKEKCEVCGDIKFNHTSFLYKNNRRIKITIHNLTEQINLIDKAAEFLGFNEDMKTAEDGIFSYGFCEICNCIVTPLVKLPEEVLNYSGTKFFENILYNSKNLINFGDEKVNILNFDIHQKDFFDANKNEDVAYHCQKLKHIHFKDISRIFITKIGAVKFRYEDIIKYKILGSLLNINSEYYINYNKKNKSDEVSIDKVWSFRALEFLITKLNVHKSIIENLKSENFTDYINRTKKVVEDAIEVAEDLKKKNELIFGDANDYENIFVYNTNLRKYLLKIMNIKMVSNKLLKKIKRIIRLIFYEEVYEMNKKAQENKNFELDSKSGQEEGSNNSINNINTKSISENLKNKDNQEINKEEIKDENNNSNNKLDLNNKGKNISAPLLKNNNDNNNNNLISNDNDNENEATKLNLSNSSSFSDIEENEDENIENNENNQEEKNNKKANDSSVIKNKSEKANVSQPGEMNINNEEKEVKKEETSNSKLIDLSLKKSIFNLSFFNTNPELKEQLNAKYNMCLNDMNKYINNILEIDKNELIQKIISKLNYYDKNHNLYSVEVDDEDICSVISYALTSTQYLNLVKIDNKNGLNEIKSEFVNDNDKSNEADKDLFCSTSLLYDIDKVKFSLGNFTILLMKKFLRF